MTGIRVVDQWTAWRDDRYFTKNPDVVRLSSGSLLCTFCLDDQHLASELAHIVLLESADDGRTWSDPRVVSESFPTKGDEPWITPRISRLRDGRLVILCDTNDYLHAHESQEPGIYAWWSDDDGVTWSGPQPTGILGIEPDRVRELPDGTLIAGSHYAFKATHKLGQVAYLSQDGGRTWLGPNVVSSDKVHHYCEGAIVPLRSGRVACIMRDNNHGGYPSYVSFSDDGGWNWSAPVEAPFSGDRPFAEQLPDGRVLVTFRNTAGRAGTMAWIGDIEAETGHQVALAGLTRQSPTVLGYSPPLTSAERAADVVAVPRLADGVLTLDAERGIARYGLLPVQGEWSKVDLQVRVRVSGDADQPCGVIQVARLGLQLKLYPGAIATRDFEHPIWHQPVDLTSWRNLRLRYLDGMWHISVDGQELLRWPVYRESLWDRTIIGLAEDAKGSMQLSSIAYEVENPTEPDHAWSWSAESSVYPNQYELDRWTMVDFNTNPRPDNGYSTWIPANDGRILVLDYTNKDAPPGKAYVAGYLIEIPGEETSAE